MKENATLSRAGDRDVGVTARIEALERDVALLMNACQPFYSGGGGYYSSRLVQDVLIKHNVLDTRFTRFAVYASLWQRLGWLVTGR